MVIYPPLKTSEVLNVFECCFKSDGQIEIINIANMKNFHLLNRIKRTSIITKGTYSSQNPRTRIVCIKGKLWFMYPTRPNTTVQFKINLYNYFAQLFFGSSSSFPQLFLSPLELLKKSRGIVEEHNAYNGKSKIK
ncbi:hypothetical protein BpHYR1_019472 [Brachionus plicatilis]|uniref:Uncharacterized protein n=1 Tax=Brachionus plicatilis TaxID=10195 RepID=A0A3M7RBW4_BRAPC|nr:hypothetical protein BpHYR1_019472 [Brachionus plicatilis]